MKDTVPGNTTIFKGVMEEKCQMTEAGEEREIKGNLEIKRVLRKRDLTLLDEAESSSNIMTENYLLDLAFIRPSVTLSRALLMEWEP